MRHHRPFELKSFASAALMSSVALSCVYWDPADDRANTDAEVGASLDDEADSEANGEVEGEPGDESSAGASEATGSVFLNLDQPPTNEQCDPFSGTSCPPGQKCAPSATPPESLLGYEEWVCVEVLGDAGTGEACENLGDPFDGQDTCDANGMCLWIDAQTGVGSCYAFCRGSRTDPQCPVGSECWIPGSGVPVVCDPICDPLTQDCPGENLCIPDLNGTGPTCVPDASGGMAPYGTPCESVNACNAGLICVAGEAVPVPGCENEPGCCSPMCDLDAPNTCPGAGQQCESVYEPGMAPEGFEQIGVCAVPTP